MTNLSEIASSLQTALVDAQKAHSALEKAKEALQPLEDAADQADNAVNVLMNQYQSLTMTDAPVRRSGAGGKGGKRGPRSAEAIIMTRASRLLKESKDDGKTKKAAAIEGAIMGITDLAKSHGGLTAEIRAKIDAKADSLWGAKK